MEPFDTFRAQLPGWTLAITTLDGVLGYCDPDRQTIWVDVNLSGRERRATIMHEIVHAIHGDRDDDPSCEERTRVETARRLIGTPALRGAFIAASHPEDVCDILDVDLDVLRTRLQNLDPDERTLLRRRLANTLPADPTSPHCALGRWWNHYKQPGALPCHTGCGSHEPAAPELADLVTFTPPPRLGAATVATPVLEHIASIAN